MNYAKLHELDQLYHQFVKDEVAPGFNVLVMTKDEKWMKAYGNRQIEPTVEKATLDTIWDVASISKVLVTTTCILKLMEEGLITLDTKIKDVLKDFKEETITIKECISHSSGLPADINGYKTMTKEEMIEAAMNIQRDPEHIGKVNYSDVNFILLGLVIKELKGSLDGYAKEAMFEPLKMYNTYYNPQAELKPRLAAYENIENRGGVVRGVVHDGKAFKLGGISGHAGVFTTIEDISHFVEMLFNDGVYHGKQFFKPETIELLKTCQTEGMNESRSVGWILSCKNYPLGDHPSAHTLYHTGFSGPSVWIDLDRKVACVTLCNRVHPSRSNVKILKLRNDIHNIACDLI